MWRALPYIEVDFGFIIHQIITWGGGFFWVWCWRLELCMQMCMHNLSTRCQADSALCCLSTVFDMGGKTINAINHLFDWNTFSFYHLSHKSWMHWHITLWWVMCNATGIQVHTESPEWDVTYFLSLQCYCGSRADSAPSCLFLTNGWSRTAARPQS